ncbi:MAG: hypothetical protein V7731_09675 [Amphritea sp.]
MRCCLFLLNALLLAGCENPKPVIKLGVLLPLSGEFQVYGQQGLNGAQLVVNEINKVGGATVGTELFNHEGIDVLRNPGVIIPWYQRQAGLAQ